MKWLFGGCLPNPSSTKVYSSTAHITTGPGHPWCSRRRHKRRWLQASIIWHWIKELETGKTCRKLRYFMVTTIVSSRDFSVNQSIDWSNNQLKQTFNPDWDFWTTKCGTSFFSWSPQRQGCRLWAHVRHGEEGLKALDDLRRCAPWIAGLCHGLSAWWCYFTIPIYG